jgi:methionine sulfoxide reductase heme-binding subunit
MWFLARSTGIVALILILFAVGDGLIFSGREGGRRHLRPAWWLDLHRGVGGYALVFTGLHMLTSFLASETGVGLAEVFVPGAASYSTAAFTWGVLAFYGMAIVVFTSWPRQRMRRKLWHVVHLLSVPAAVLAAVHAYQLGSDARTSAFLFVLVVAIGLTMYPVGLRLSGIARRRHERMASPQGALR